MTDITKEVVVAVVSRIRSEITEISDRIYFEPPQKTAFPYISYRFDVNDVPMKTTQGQDFIFTFSVFAQRESASSSAILTATQITAKLYDAFDKHNLSLTAGHVVCCQWDGFQTAIPEEDGRTIQMVTRFKIFATNNV